MNIQFADGSLHVPKMASSTPFPHKDAPKKSDQRQKSREECATQVDYEHEGSGGSGSSNVISLQRIAEIASKNAHSTTRLCAPPRSIGDTKVSAASEIDLESLSQKLKSGATAKADSCCDSDIEMPEKKRPCCCCNHSTSFVDFPYGTCSMCLNRKIESLQKQIDELQVNVTVVQNVFQTEVIKQGGVANLTELILQ